MDRVGSLYSFFAISNVVNVIVVDGYLDLCICRLPLLPGTPPLRDSYQPTVMLYRRKLATFVTWAIKFGCVISLGSGFDW